MTMEIDAHYSGQRMRPLDPCEDCHDKDTEIARLRSIVERASRLEGLYYNTHLNPEGFRLTIEGIARDAKAALAVPNA